MPNVTIKFSGIEKTTKRINQSRSRIRAGLIELGNRTQEYFRRTIKQNTKRRGSTGTLSNSIQSKVYVDSADMVLVGIGNKADIQEVAKYWYVVNYGVKISGQPFLPPGNIGNFEGKAPQSRYAGGSVSGRAMWSHGTPYYMQPKTFRPMHYIEKTNAWLISYWESFWNRKFK